MLELCMAEGSTLLKMEQRVSWRRMFGECLHVWRTFFCWIFCLNVANKNMVEAKHNGQETSNLWLEDGCSTTLTRNGITL